MTRSRYASSRDRRVRRATGGALLIVALAACGGGNARSSATSTTAVTTTVATTTTTSATATVPTATSTPTPPPVAPGVPDGPSYDRDFPDPFVMWTGAGYHALSTASALRQLPHLDGPDFTHWTGPTDVLADTPLWATPLSTWAPTVLARNGQYRVYFTAQVRDTKMHCISVAVGPTVDGPFRDDGREPLLCPRDLGGAIDPSVFVDRDGSRWLLWKNDGVTLRRESAIWSQRLSGDGLHLVGDPVRLIATDQTWEYPHVEAPSMALVGSTYWLAYSGNWWNQAAYGVGMAECASAAGPCTKPFDHAVLTSRPGREGPGGGEFFTDATGRLLLAYHAWLDTPGYPGHRALFIAAVTFDDGLPVIG